MAVVLAGFGLVAWLPDLGADLAVETGILIPGSSAVIGDDGDAYPWANTIGQALT